MQKTSDTVELKRKGVLRVQKHEEERTIVEGGRWQVVWPTDRRKEMGEKSWQGNWVKGEPLKNKKSKAKKKKKKKTCSITSGTLKKKKKKDRVKEICKLLKSKGIWERAFD